MCKVDTVKWTLTEQCTGCGAAGRGWRITVRRLIIARVWDIFLPVLWLARPKIDVSRPDPLPANKILLHPTPQMDILTRLIPNIKTQSKYFFPSCPIKREKNSIWTRIFTKILSWLYFECIILISKPVSIKNQICVVLCLLLPVTPVIPARLIFPHLWPVSHPSC